MSRNFRFVCGTEPFIDNLKIFNYTSDQLISPEELTEATEDFGSRGPDKDALSVFTLFIPSKERERGNLILW
jgi:hypothetical protein